MTDEVFGTPTEPGEAFRPAEHVDNFVLFLGVQRDEVTTKHGDAVVADCDLIIVMNDALNESGEVYEGWVFGAVGKGVLAKNNEGNISGWIREHEYDAGSGYKLEVSTTKERKALNGWAKDNLSKVKGQWLLRSDEAPF